MGSSRVRFFSFKEQLERQGWSVVLCPLQQAAFTIPIDSGPNDFAVPLRLMQLSRDYFHRLVVVLRADTFTTVWIEKELFPYLPPLFETWLTNRGVQIVVDYDDATFHVYDEHSSTIVRHLLGRKIDSVMRVAALTVAGNNYLASRAVRAGSPSVVTIPSSVDFERYRRAAHLPLNRPSDGNPIIGWIGSPSTAKYLHLIGPAIAEVQRITNSQVVLVGSGPIDIPGVDVKTLPWSEATEVDLIQSFNVGIMPIAQTNWERGKCGFKLIQYMAAGVPTVATAFGANNDITRHGRTGFLAKTHEEWVAFLSQLLSNKTLANTMGLEGSMRARDEYSVQVNGPKLVGAFEQLLRERRF